MNKSLFAECIYIGRWMNLKKLNKRGSNNNGIFYDLMLFFAVTFRRNTNLNLNNILNCSQLIDIKYFENFKLFFGYCNGYHYTYI